MEVHIIGAGPSGIALSYFLSKKNIKSNVYESDSTIGGMGKSWCWNNCILDTGPHIFHTPDPLIQELWLSEAGDLLKEGEYYSANLMDDKSLHPYPVSMESIPSLPDGDQILHELSNVDLANCSKATSFEEYVSLRLGNTLASLFFKGYPEKLWGIPTRNMLPNWAPQRISIREKNSPFYVDQFSAVARYGTGSVLERFAQEAQENSKYNLNSKVVSLESSNDHSSITSFKLDNGRNVQLSDEDFLVSTIPIPLLLSLFGIKSKLQFRGILTTYLLFENSSILPDPYSWMYIPQPNIIFNRITEASKLSSDVSPEGKSLLSVETVIAGGFHPKHYLESIFNRVLKDFSKLQSNPLIYSPICDSTFHYEPFVYPISDLESTSELADARAYLEPFRNLITFGCGGDFHYGDMQIFFSKAQDVADDFATSSSSILLKPDFEKELTPLDDSKLVNSNTSEETSIAVKVIAEIGLNHSGNIRLAKDMIKAAKDAQADYVKLQLYTTESRYSSLSREHRYAEGSLGEELTLPEEFNRSQLSIGDCDALIEFARSIDIGIFFTVFDNESLEYVKDRNIDIVKLASMDLNNYVLHEQVAKFSFGTVLISTGMSSINEVIRAVNSYSNSSSQLVLMQCSSVYPLHDSDVNLFTLKSFANIQSNPSLQLGFSDHTSDTLASLLSLSLGVKWIEKHFTTDRRLPGPDNKFSLTPKMLSQFTNDINRASMMMGSSSKSLLPTEMITYRAQKKTLVFPCDFSQGHHIKLSDLELSPPPIGMHPLEFEEIINPILKKKVSAGTPVKKEHFI